ncbi:hypothetical protein POMI540_1203 [Schizosaccharomyces pombe]|uniref:Uncharacterized protein C3A12.08 n=1 Tax=Schizosaccharomyces pombe (strain 972 / ATCC 24843) TaxID=284812 RepID=YDL8_SCHPO|nr:uncharacterized protein SPAC3A12.08 [Schizosaccharomyces pombe]P87124.1 RecName: Full=Uncharacterized protein C3A12.08 [Schizosaccharomyces pombe 972h-]CAB08753.1 conserved fungal protein [Schizosaccharomyces pombe]|eukprot:NP_593334.1 uncharacterized protein SPAC3A12.08 [Schizosaccharomyces pombe]
MSSKLFQNKLLLAGIGGFMVGGLASWVVSSDAYTAYHRLPASAKHISEISKSPEAVQMIDNIYRERQRSMKMEEHPSLLQSKYPSNFLSFKDGLIPVFKTFYDPEHEEWISIGLMGKALTGYQKLAHGGAIATLLIESLETVRNLRSSQANSQSTQPRDPIPTENFDVRTPSYSINYKKPVPAGDWVIVRVKDDVARLYNSKSQLLAEALDLQS